MHCTPYAACQALVRARLGLDPVVDRERVSLDNISLVARGYMKALASEGSMTKPATIREGGPQVCRPVVSSQRLIRSADPQVVQPFRIEEVLVGVDHASLPRRTARTRSLTLRFISASDSSL